MTAGVTLRALPARTLSIGTLGVSPPVVLAPMAGVTNAPFRQLCREYGAGLYVSEMVLAQALLHGNARTERMLSFAAGESPRSMQLYGSDPAVVGGAVARLVGDGRVDHVDLNFGCPARKVTRRGGGAAVPLKPRLLAAIIGAAVHAAGAVPVTVKFRLGVTAALPTWLATGRIAEGEGAAAVALHARTAEQHYAGPADWDAIGELKSVVATIPVLGNGDIWEAADALRMIAATGCDGVVVGRGCLGRPWLFGDLADAFAGRPVAPPPRLGEVAAVLRRHAALLVDWFGSRRGPVELRKHAGWYLTGYPVGPELRRRFAMVSSLDELDDLLARLDPAAELPPGAERIARGHTNGPIAVALPDGYLDDLDDATPPPEAGRAALTGG
jgi:nifR3 family TIM-barrel protein